MKMYVLEGTPAEIKSVMQSLALIDAPDALRASKLTEQLGAEAEAIANDDDQATRFVTIEFARATLTRLPLSKPFKKVLTVLREAYPDMVAVADLHKASGYDGAQFAGLMGAFGRRMKHTDGYHSEATFFSSEWDEEVEAWKYGLPVTVIEALQAEAILK